MPKKKRRGNKVQATPQQFSRQHRNQAAITLVQQIHDLNISGLKHYNTKQYQRAIKDYSLSIQLLLNSNKILLAKIPKPARDKNLTYAYLIVGKCYLHLNDLNLAHDLTLAKFYLQQSCNVTGENNKHTLEASFRLACLLWDGGEKEHSVELFSTIVKKPGNCEFKSSSYLHLAKYELMRDNCEQAETYCLLSIENDPNNHHTKLKIAYLYMEQKKFDDTLKWFKEITSYCPIPKIQAEANLLCGLRGFDLFNMSKEDVENHLIQAAQTIPSTNLFYPSFMYVITK